MGQHIGLQRTVNPAEEPLTLAEAKTWLRVDADDTTQDSTITELIQAGRERCEKVSGRALITQTWKLTLDRFPYWDGSGKSYWDDYEGLGGFDNYAILMPRPPLQSVTSIQYVDTAGVLQPLDASVYQVDIQSEPGRIMPAYGQIWPTVRYQLGAVSIVYVAGYGAASVLGKSIKDRIRSYVAYRYENREQFDEDFCDRLFDAFWTGMYQ